MDADLKSEINDLVWDAEAVLAYVEAKKTAEEIEQRMRTAAQPLFVQDAQVPAAQRMRTAAIDKSDIGATLAERGARYGAFIDHATIVQELHGVMMATAGWKRLKPDQKQALQVIADKIGRMLNGDPDYHDNWHDIGGYAKLVADRLLGVVK